MSETEEKKLNKDGLMKPQSISCLYFAILAASVFSLVATGCRMPAQNGYGHVPFPALSKPRAITQGPHDHFFANYAAVNAWSDDLRYVGVLETDLNGRLPEANERCTLGLVDTQDGNHFIPVTTTACWNFQEATMFHWLPGEKDTFVFNDMRDGKFVAVVMNWKNSPASIKEI